MNLKWLLHCLFPFLPTEAEGSGALEQGSTPQHCQRHQKWGKYEKLSQPRGAGSLFFTALPGIMKSEKAYYAELWWKLRTKAVPFELNSGYKYWSRNHLILVFRWLAWNRFLVNYNKAEWRRLPAWQQFSKVSSSPRGRAGTHEDRQELC